MTRPACARSGEHLGEHGRLLVVVDQPATIGALAVAVAQDMGITKGYLPGPVDEAHRRPVARPAVRRDQRDASRDRQRGPAPCRAHAEVDHVQRRGRRRAEHAHRFSI